MMMEDPMKSIYKNYRKIILKVNQNYFYLLLVLGFFTTINFVIKNIFHLIMKINKKQELVQRVDSDTDEAYWI